MLNSMLTRQDSREIDNGIDPKEYHDLQNADWVIVNNELLQLDHSIPE